MSKANNQIELEKQNLEIMIDTTNQRIEKAVRTHTTSDLKQTRNVVPYYVNELNNRLLAYINSMLSGKAKIMSVPYKVLTLIPSEVVAHITVKTLMNYIGNKQVTANNIFAKIAEQLSNEHKLHYMKDKPDKTYKRFVENIQKSGHKGFRVNQLTKDLISKYHNDLNKYGLTKSFYSLAQLATHLLSECRPVVNNNISPVLFHMEEINFTGANSKLIIYPADWFIQWLRQATLEGQMLNPYHTPLIEEPKPWTSFRVGGFHTKRFSNKIVKTRIDDREYSITEMKATVDSINTLQKTKWEINTDILEVMQYVLVNNLGWGNFPRPVKVERSEYPFPDMSRKDMNEDQLAISRAWSAHHARLFDEFHSETSKYLAVLRAVNEAKRFKQYDKIYFAYQADFRGRLYPIASNLHPQGSEYVKALLRFHEAKPLRSLEAVKFLCVQGANTYGNDKVTMEEKYQWVLSNEKQIIASGNDPYLNDFWQSADEPWLFLAFCFEWKEYRRDPVNFKSKLPVALDGSCNGLQHLSALMRDEVGGRSVNLTPNAVKADIYADVAEVARVVLGSMENPLARRLLEFGISRSTTKRSVMIVPYSGTPLACRRYIDEELKGRGAMEYFGEQYWEALSLLTEAVWAAIGQVIIKGREVMQWFKQATRVVCKFKTGKNNTIIWTTPNGFRVVQHRVLANDEIIRTNLGDMVRLSTTMRIDTDDIDKRGHATSIAPNFIHALDACCLQNTVNRLPHVSLAMIHDSYGTHADDTAEMARVLREEFVKVYEENDVISNWMSEQSEKSQKEIPERPLKGNLDLQGILQSEFFFS